jgi:hypothetical protein
MHKGGHPWLVLRGGFYDMIGSVLFCISFSFSFCFCFLERNAIS